MIATELDLDDLSSDIPFYYAEELLGQANQAQAGGNLPVAVEGLIKALYAALTEATETIDALAERVDLLETQVSNLEEGRS